MTAYPSFLFFRTFTAVMLMYAVTAGHAGSEEDAWNACSTPKTEFVPQVPASLIHSTAPTATGCSFQTLEGDFNVEAVAVATEQGET